MKLFRFGEHGSEKPGVITQSGKKIDVSGFVKDFNEDFFGDDGISKLKTWLTQNEKNCPTVSGSIRIGSCISRPSKIVCVGLNYAKHAQETGAASPPEPVLFFKSTTALCGPNDSVIIPKNSQKTDWEVELAVIMGKVTRYADENEAKKNIAGYAVHNDYSEREFQMERNGQWVKGKSADTFAPLGPYLVTADEIADPQNLDLWLKVNGEQLQHSNTNDMIFKIPFVISYISQFMTLLPGDVISTGTPAGVGLGFKPPRYLKPGDVVELSVQNLGEQKQVARAYSN
jgi:2,4-diketo-3-deoxy-L-fuconate hydrolase